MTELKMVSWNDDIIFEGVALTGSVRTSYENLVKAFGEPTNVGSSGDNKSKIEWLISFSDGTVATIYDWKNYSWSVEDVMERNEIWNIGGRGKDSVRNVARILQSKKLKASLTFE